MIGRSVANRPYMYLPLKGDTNDYSVNAQNPTNNGATTATGEFGESNGAYYFSGTSDRLEWSNTIGQTVAAMLNNEFTYIAFVNINGTSTGYVPIFSQWNSPTNQNAFTINLQEPTSTTRRLQLNISTDGTGSLSVGSDSFFTYNSWVAMAVTSKDNTSNNSIKFYKNGTSVLSTTISKNKADSTEPLKVYYTPSFGMGNYTLTIHDMKVYNNTLSQGQITILHNEKGRIRA